MVFKDKKFTVDEANLKFINKCLLKINRVLLYQAQRNEKIFRSLHVHIFVKSLKTDQKREQNKSF